MLTEDGEQLFRIVAESLQNISVETEKLRKKSIVNQLHIETDMGFATYWLLPRLDALQKMIPEVDVQISTSPNEFKLRESHADLAILFGDGHWPGCHSEKLFPELVVPVCSPQYIKEHGNIQTPAQLQNCLLLNLPDTKPSRWLTWHDWFLANGVNIKKHEKSVTFNAYSLVIQAALRGKGVALGWLPLVNDLLERGELVLATGRSVTTERGYYLVEQNNKPSLATHEKVKNWIVTEAFAMRNTRKVYSKIAQ